MASQPPRPDDTLPPGLGADVPEDGERWSWRRRIVTLLAGLALSAAVVLNIGFLVFIDGLSRQETEFGQPVDGISALTGGADRIVDALAVLQEGRAKRLLISGVNTQTSVAALVRKSGHAHLFECCIDIGRGALNTVGNAIETADWARRNDYRSLILVTSNYHMPRAMVELRRHLKNVQIIAHPVISESVRIESWWREPALFRLLYLEYLKYLAAEARSRLVPDDPAPAR